MDAPAITLRDVSKSFGPKVVLRRASLVVEHGETVAILGASGCGKSVTLKTVNGLVPTDSGEVTVLGQRVSDLAETDLFPLRRRVSYLFQGGALFDSMNVRDNVAFPIREHLQLTEDEVLHRVAELLAMVRLDGAEELVPAELSGGMRKRVAVARALALEPQIILYDEPTTGLDPITSDAIAELILELDHRLGVTSVVVTHDIPLVSRVAGRVVFLHQGEFVYSGSVAAARSDAPALVRSFFTAGGAHA